MPDLSSPSGAYHLVWSRDAYQFGTALWAAGDHAAARRLVDWLSRVQQKPDGSSPQNSDVDGTPAPYSPQERWENQAGYSVHDRRAGRRSGVCGRPGPPQR